MSQEQNKSESSKNRSFTSWLEYYSASLVSLGYKLAAVLQRLWFIPPPPADAPPPLEAQAPPAPINTLSHPEEKSSNPEKTLTTSSILPPEGLPQAAEDAKLFNNEIKKPNLIEESLPLQPAESQNETYPNIQLQAALAEAQCALKRATESKDKASIKDWQDLIADMDSAIDIAENLTSVELTGGLSKAAIDLYKEKLRALIEAVENFVEISRKLPEPQSRLPYLEECKKYFKLLPNLLEQLNLFSNAENNYFTFRYKNVRMAFLFNMARYHKECGWANLKNSEFSQYLDNMLEESQCYTQFISEISIFSAITEFQPGAKKCQFYYVANLGYQALMHLDLAKIPFGGTPQREQILEHIFTAKNLLTKAKDAISTLGLDEELNAKELAPFLKSRDYIVKEIPKITKNLPPLLRGCVINDTSLIKKSLKNSIIDDYLVLIALNIVSKYRQENVLNYFIRNHKYLVERWVHSLSDLAAKAYVEKRLKELKKDHYTTSPSVSGKSSTPPPPSDDSKMPDTTIHRLDDFKKYIDKAEEQAKNAQLLPIRDDRFQEALRKERECLTALKKEGNTDELRKLIKTHKRLNKKVMYLLSIQPPLAVQPPPLPEAALDTKERRPTTSSDNAVESISNFEVKGSPPLAQGCAPPEEKVSQQSFYQFVKDFSKSTQPTTLKDHINNAYYLYNIKKIIEDIQSFLTIAEAKESSTIHPLMPVYAIIYKMMQLMETLKFVPSSFKMDMTRIRQIRNSLAHAEWLLNTVVNEASAQTGKKAILQACHFLMDCFKKKNFLRLVDNLFFSQMIKCGAALDDQGRERIDNETRRIYAATIKSLRVSFEQNAGVIAAEIPMAALCMLNAVGDIYADKEFVYIDHHTAIQSRHPQSNLPFDSKNPAPLIISGDELDAKISGKSNFFPKTRPSKINKKWGQLDMENTILKFLKAELNEEQVIKIVQKHIKFFVEWGEHTIKIQLKALTSDDNGSADRAERLNAMITSINQPPTLPSILRNG